MKRRKQKERKTRIEGREENRKKERQELYEEKKTEREIDKS